MGTATPDGKIREALSMVGQYLSDTIPPVHAAESVIALLNHPPELIASEIISWVPSQLNKNNRNASVADYLVHAVSKLYYLAHLQLIPEKALAPHLEFIKRRLLDYCPPGNRHALQENFARLGTSETTMAVPINLIYRQVNPGESASAIAESPVPEQPRDRRRSILRDRLKSKVRRPALAAGGKDREDLVPHLIANAASDARSEDEFQKLQENLKSLGMDAGTDQIYRTLSQGLPGWMIASTDIGAIKSRNPAIEAMRQILHLAENRWEGNQRFQDMVQAAIEQFNTGSPARAATMFDLALSLSSDKKLDQTSVMKIRGTAHESLDLNRLRNLAKEREKHPLLKRVLNFFEEYSVETLLNSLQNEEKRERRRLLLDLIETHGDGARTMAFERLKELLAGTDVATDWHFARNLVCILNRIPCAVGVPLKPEIDLVAPLLRLSLPAPLIKESIKYAGQTKCDEFEELLISTVDKLEKVVPELADSGKDPTQKISLLDRAVFELAHYGTPKANARVVKHAMLRREELGDTFARLAYLSGQDLSGDRESIATLVQFIKSKMPRKLFGVTIQKNEDLLLQVIKVLSSTPDVVVRLTLDVVAEQFPETKFGQAAASALKEFGAMDKPGIPSERMLTGDLDLFGLPDLLQQLSTSQVTGALTLKDAKGILIGSFSLLAGRMRDCSAGLLKGNEAAYQLIEKPAAGTFVVHGQRNSGIREPPDKRGGQDIDSILAEGMRRYDELQRARAIVPDFALLKHKESEQIPHSEEKDAELLSQVWQKTAAGASPEECEAICLADSYRVRTLLARWVEEGVLTVD